MFVLKATNAEILCYLLPTGHAPINVHNSPYSEHPLIIRIYTYFPQFLKKFIFLQPTHRKNTNLAQELIVCFTTVSMA